MPLNPPTYKGPDVYYSTNVFVNKVPVALWQPPAGAFNDGGPGTRKVGGEVMYANNESGKQRLIKDTIAQQGKEGAKEDQGGAPPAAADVPTKSASNPTPGTTAAPTASMVAQPGDVELKIENLPDSFGPLTDPIYQKRISKYFRLSTIKNQIVPSYGVSAKGVATNWINLCVNVLDPIYSEFKFKFNSGFRDPAYNAKVGGAKTSDHLFGKAADISMGSEDANKKMFLWIIKSGLPFRQLLIERANGTWIHVAYDGGRKLNEARRVMYINTKTGEKRTFGVNGEGAAAWVGG